MNIYEKCPVFENEQLLVRLIEPKDAKDLLSVYNDKLALPFFNSDNCHGSNFYCRNLEDMQNTIKYWLIEYHENRCFVRFSIVDKRQGKAIGTIEMFNRNAEDFYNNCGILRLDLGSDYEKSDLIYDILSLVTAPFYEWFECPMIATKASVYAIDRIEALEKVGYAKSEEPLVGHDKTSYYDYWIINRKAE